MISDTLWHLVIRVTARGAGMDRRLDYALSDVIRHTQEGADPLAEWSDRRPDDVALWVVWHPLRGMRYAGITSNVTRMGNLPAQEAAMPPALTRVVLEGIALALRIDSGEFGPGVDSCRGHDSGPRDNDKHNGVPSEELIDPQTLEITDGL